VTRARAATGFTLLEMMVTLVLAGLLTTLVPPLLERSGDGAKLRKDTRILAATLALAHSQAIARAAIADVVIDLETRRFGIGGLNEWTDGGTAVAVNFAATDRLTERHGRIRFFPMVRPAVARSG
jgi:type II secretion system protein H